MKIEIRYETRSGNTKALAEEIAYKLGIKTRDLDNPINKSTDLLFIGGGTYFMKPDESLINFINSLSSNDVKNVALITTSGGPEK